MRIPTASDLRRAKNSARARAGTFKFHLDRTRDQLKEARREVKRGQARAEALEQERDALKLKNAEQASELRNLRGTRAKHATARFGSKSEKRKKKEGTGNKRGQQPGKRAATGALRVRSSRRSTNAMIHRHRSARARVAASPMWPTAATRPRSWRSMSRLISGGLNVGVGAVVVSVRRRLRRSSRRHLCACLRIPPSASVSGNACSMSASPACVPCAGSRDGWKTRDCRWRRERSLAA